MLLTAPSSRLFLGHSSYSWWNENESQIFFDFFTKTPDLLITYVYFDDILMTYARFDDVYLFWWRTPILMTYTCFDDVRLTLQAIGYSCIPTSRNEDGLVTITFKKTAKEVSASQQQVVDNLHKILGSKPNLSVCVESLKPAPDDKWGESTVVKDRYNESLGTEFFFVRFALQSNLYVTNINITYPLHSESGSRFAASFDYPPLAIIHHLQLSANCLSATLNHPPPSIILHPRLSTTFNYLPPLIIRHPRLSATLSYSPFRSSATLDYPSTFSLALMVTDNGVDCISIIWAGQFVTEI